MGALDLFDARTASWFETSVGTPTAVQEQGWPAIAQGEHVLISAPTGTGKTLSAFLVYIDSLMQEAREGLLPEGLQVLYISPLKALGNDIRENLRRPLEGIEGPRIEAAVRTGDTTQAERRRMANRPPHILITTPESLFLLLTSRSGRRMLTTLRAVIIDELHAMINSKRGAHLMLSLSRLDALCERKLQRIGLSATIEPLDAAAQYLSGGQPVRVIAPRMLKSVDIQVQSPLPDMRILPEGTIWPELAKAVFAHCEGMRTVIVFVEGRTQAEKLARGVNDLGGEGFARTHHGSVSKEKRLEAENLLRSGELRLLCATSSMELGIDVGEVDKVLQIGVPVTISSTMQRLGRAGHSPGRTSVMRLLPRTGAETLTCGLTARLARDGGIEQSKPPLKCLDVLAQHLVSMAVDTQYTVEGAMQMLGGTYSFRHVTQAELEGVLCMLAGDFEHARDQPARPRLLYDRIHGIVEGDAYSRMLALSAGGTIPDRGLFAAKLADGTRLGELDEEFVFEARIGDKFLLGSFAWRITQIGRDTVTVAPATAEGAQPPFWKGDGTGRNYRTGQAFGRLMRQLMEANSVSRLSEALQTLLMDEAAVANASYHLKRQIEATGALPDDRTILVEHFCDEAGEHQMMVHSIFGRQVNMGLSLLIQEMARRETGMDVSVFDDDDGFLLFPYGGNRRLPEGLLPKIHPDIARPMLSALLPATPLFNMAFRYNASRALLMGARKGGRQPLWIQRLRGAQVLDEAVGLPEHPIMQETRRECMTSYLDVDGLEDVLRKVQSGEIAVREIHRDVPSPMALPLRRAAVMTMMYDYTPTPRGVYSAVDEALGAQQMIAPAKEQLAQVMQRKRQPADMQQLHALLMAEGDFVAGEVDVPIKWLTDLADGGRALYREPGIWICQEQAAQYASVLDEMDMSSLIRIVRRCLRYRGPQDAESIADRYALDDADASHVLDALLASGEAVQDDGLVYHAQLYERAQRQTVAQRRREIRTLPKARYQALRLKNFRTAGKPQDQLRDALTSLLARPYPLALWESTLLPARVLGYRPAMLDALLAEGAFFYRIEAGERTVLSFHRQTEIDYQAEPCVQGESLSEAEQAIVSALLARGALFAQALSPVLPAGESPLPYLLSLLSRGFVHADSFLPVRQLLDMEGQKNEKRRARARAVAAVAGRWELSRALLPKAPEALLEAAFDRATLLCRETMEEMTWTEALSILRVWEYTGRVRRGYYIEGLSGAQFIREGDHAAAMIALQSPPTDIVWLSAADPAQAWGRSLPHDEDRAFLCVPGTAVALRAGEPVAVFERNGAQLRLFDQTCAIEALQAFAREYELGHVYASQKRLTVKRYPEEAEEALIAAGFSKQMLEYELWQRPM